MQSEKKSREAREVEERSSPGGHIVYKAVKKEGEDELKRSKRRARLVRTGGRVINVFFADQ